MSAKDRFHGAVRKGLEKEGWIITDDPLRIEVGDVEMYVDLGAEHAEYERKVITKDDLTRIFDETKREIRLGNRRARLGKFVGFSDEHSSMVANVRHLTTGYISPQFHVVFDDLFETVNRTGVDDQVVESICNGLFQRNRELYAEDELDEDFDS